MEEEIIVCYYDESEINMTGKRMSPNQQTHPLLRYTKLMFQKCRCSWHWL